MIYCCNFQYLHLFIKFFKKCDLLQYWIICWFTFQYGDYKVIYRRYAGLFFSLCVDVNDNELVHLESIHLFVELLDQFFGNVCELDLVFNFHKVCGTLNMVYGIVCRNILKIVHVLWYFKDGVLLWILAEDGVVLCTCWCGTLKRVV